MTEDRSLPDAPPVVRIDSFEIVDADCDPSCTDEELTWPVAPFQVRIDSFEVIE